MASLKETKRRISSVKSTQKITRAMKLVSSAKFAKANSAIAKAAPYKNELDRAIAHLLEQGDEAEVFANSFFSEPVEEKKALMLVLASDRGLCGGLNANLIKAANSAMKQKEQKGVQFELCLWGRRCYNLEKLQERTVLEKKEKILESFSYASVKAESERLAKLFFQGKYDKIYVVYPRFKNALSQEATVETFLPVPATPLNSGVGLDESNAQLELRSGTLLEPELGRLITDLLSQQLAARLHEIFLSALTSEHAARMTAMDSATNNAEEVVKSLTLEYNRARQAAITKELIEITSGAEAL